MVIGGPFNGRFYGSKLWNVWSIVHCQPGVTGAKSGCLTICSNMAGEQLGKDMKWHNITACTSVNFALQASTLIWPYFRRHGDSCPSFNECINIDCSGGDMDIITPGIIVIAYINIVGLLLFSNIGSTSWWLLVWILQSTGGASASGIPVTNFATRSACGVLGRAGGSARYMRFCTIPTCMLALGFWCFLLLLLGLRLRSLAPFVDSIDSFHTKAHSIEVVCYGYVGTACLNILAVVAFRSRASNFLTSSLSVRAQTRWNWTCHSFPSSVGKLHLSARPLRRSTSSSGVSPGLIHTSSNWYIQHLWDTVLSICDAKWSRKDFVLFLVAATSSVVTPAGVHWFHFWQPVVPRKFRMYSMQAFFVIWFIWYCLKLELSVCGLLK